MSDGTRTYEILTSKGKQRITVPEDTKVTFGAIVPGAKANGYSGGGWGLRVWRDANHQLAVFSDVISFRDLSIPVEVAAVRKFGEDHWTIDDGTYVGKKAGTVEKKWMAVEEVAETVPLEPLVTDGDWAESLPSIRATRYASGGKTR